MGKVRSLLLLAAFFHWSVLAFEICSFDQLADVSSIVDGRRTPEDIFALKKFKNGSNKDPKQVDLSARCVAASCEPLMQHKTWSKDSPDDPIEYERLVLGLRQGDSVLFGNEEYKLGRFLGAGNATHIFALADQPGKAIRIPFLVPGLHALMQHRLAEKGQHATRMERMLRPAASFARKHATMPNAVKVYKFDPFNRYAIVELIEGNQNGLPFLSDVARRTVRLHQHLRYPTDFPKDLPPEQAAQLKSLVSAIAEDMKIMPRMDGSIEFSSSYARQYLYSEERGRWYNLDPE